MAPPVKMSLTPLIQTMEYYLALKRNELSSHEKRWRNFKCILTPERSQSERANDCVYDTLNEAKYEY